MIKKVFWNVCRIMEIRKFVVIFQERKLNWMKHKSFIAFWMLILSFSLVGCSNVEVFETTIEWVEAESFAVDCSVEVNRHKTGAIDDIGYICHILITEATDLLNAKNEEIAIEHFEDGDHVRITLTKPMNISERVRTLEAKKIMKLNEE